MGKWTSDENEILKREYPVKGSDIEALSTKTKDEIRYHARYLGLYAPKRAVVLPGTVFGRLTTIERVTGKGRPHWKCRCECGTTCVILEEAMWSGNTVSCGCKRKEVAAARLKNIYKTPSFDSALKKTYRDYKISAKTRSIAFELSFDDFRVLVTTACHYCGAAPSRHVNGYPQFDVGGVDRMDNEPFYRKENSLPCCIIDNIGKGEMKYAEYIEHLRRSALYRLNTDPYFEKKKAPATATSNNADA